MSSTATPPKTIIVKERIRFGPVPPEMVPTGEQPLNILSVNHHSEGDGFNFNTTRYVGNLNTFDMNLFRRNTTLELREMSEEAEVEFQSA